MPDAEFRKGVDPSRQDKEAPEIVVSTRAFQVAKEWVKNMSGGADSDSEVDDSATVELEARPPRLGLGAKYLPHSQVTTTLNPVERKLRSMTNTEKQRGEMPTGNHRFPGSPASGKASKLDVQTQGREEEGQEEEEDIRGSSLRRNGRQQKRITSADLLMTVGSKGRGGKRKR